MNDRNGIPKVPISAAGIGILIALLAQAGALVIWATSEHNARVALQERFDLRAREIDNRLTAMKPYEVIDQRLKGVEDRNAQQDVQLARGLEFLRTLNDKQNVVNTQTGARIDEANGHLSRLDDRVDRVVQALDSVYKQFVDHLRETDGKK